MPRRPGTQSRSPTRSTKMRKLLLLFCLLCPGAWAAISAPSNCAINSGGSGSTISTGAFGTIATSCATAASKTAGNQITVYISYLVASGGSITTGCVDTSGNIYHLVAGAATTTANFSITD